MLAAVALLSAAVVKNAGKFNDNPELLAVIETPLAVSAVLVPSPSLEARAVVIALVAPAVVRKAGTFRLIPELFTVQLTPFAVRAVLRPTASFEARAVVSMPAVDGTV